MSNEEIKKIVEKVNERGKCETSTTNIEPIIEECIQAYYEVLDIISTASAGKNEWSFYEWKKSIMKWKLKNNQNKTVRELGGETY